jgi:hypothetical protein
MFIESRVQQLTVTSCTLDPNPAHRNRWSGGYRPDIAPAADFPFHRWWFARWSGVGQLTVSDSIVDRKRLQHRWPWH